MTPVSDTLAVIADIHGNIWALDAVLADIDGRGITQIVNLGDSLYGSLDPAATADRLIERAILSIRGNQDRIILEPGATALASPDHTFMTSRLRAEHYAWLRQQPTTTTIGAVFCCHGTPSSDETYLLEHVTAQGVALQRAEHIAAQVHTIGAAVIVCGHSHVPRTVGLPDGRLIVNPGSVGIPAYADRVPVPHVMEAGSPHARYAVLTQQAAGWRVEHVAVGYAWQHAAAVARRHGRPDRAAWIESGRARVADER